MNRGVSACFCRSGGCRRLRSNLLRAATSRGFVETSDGGFEFDVSRSLTCRYEPDSRVLWTRMAPSGIPCSPLDLLRDMERGSQIVESHFASPNASASVAYVVLTSSIPKVFNLGGDFGSFLEQIRDAGPCRANGVRKECNQCCLSQLHLSQSSRCFTTVALLEGDALGGGLECALSCDVIIAGNDMSSAVFRKSYSTCSPAWGRSRFCRAVAVAVLFKS